MSIDLLLLFFLVLRFLLSSSDSEESPEESEFDESDLCLFLAATSLRSFSLLSSPSEESPLPFSDDEPEPDEELEESFFFRFRLFSAEEESLFSLRGGARSFSSSDESCRGLALAFGVVSGESGSFW